MRIPSTYKLFHDRGRYHIETNLLICSANQWTGFYMITASAMKEFIISSFLNVPMMGPDIYLMLLSQGKDYDVK